MPRSNEELLSHVLSELDSDPQVDDDRLFVDVEGGLVRLTGTVHSLRQKWAAAQAARRVAGTAAVVDEILVRSR